MNENELELLQALRDALYLVDSSTLHRVGIIEYNRLNVLLDKYCALSNVLSADNEGPDEACTAHDCSCHGEVEIEDVHTRHCYQGEYENNCKYNKDEVCTARIRKEG